MPGWVDAAVGDYQRRLRDPWRLTVTELPVGARGQAGGALERAKASETRAILGQLSTRDFVVALDEHGTESTTLELARWLAERQAGGQDLAFVLGGPDGLSAEVLQRARRRWSLSRLTLAHGLARVVLIEQLYRAVCVLAGHPYHRE